jgi:hypothetical protein
VLIELRIIQPDPHLPCNGSLIGWTEHRWTKGAVMRDKEVQDA